jgi:hypothetical protein
MSNQVVYKITTLKEFVEFAFSLKEMEEVKNNNFPTPSNITYTLTKRNHESLQKEILKEKNIPVTTFDEEFEVELYGITFKFIYK